MKFFKRLLIIDIIILAIILLLFLITNSCFFFTTYRGAGDKTIFVPRFCYLYKEGGMTIATFYSFRSQKALQKEIDEYLSDFEHLNGDAYVKDDLYIGHYKVFDNGLYRRVSLLYDPLY